MERYGFHCGLKGISLSRVNEFLPFVRVSCTEFHTCMVLVSMFRDCKRDEYICHVNTVFLH